MRDYSFGNFISALRVRRGLSQYQLGALVGVSDKAISKWENGVSKPRTNTIMKLAEVLDVGIDELLTCKYVTFNHKRKDLFAMDKEIIKKVEYRMHELYGEQVSFFIKNRVKTEELMLKNQMMLRWIGFLGELHTRLYEEDGFFLVRGAQIGASFVAWLLGGTNVNPLPAHYYCQKCKKVEFIPTAKCGIDAPDKICSCGTPYKKDGFGINEIHMYPMSGGIEINVTKNAMEIAQDCFKDYFCEYSEIRKMEIEDASIKGDEKLAKFHFNTARYILVPGEIAGQYPEEVIKVSLKDSCLKFLGFERITITEDPKPFVSFKKIENLKISDNIIKGYLGYAIEEGKLNNISGKQDFNELASNLSNPCFSDLLAIEGILHGTGVWEENGEILYANGIALNELLTNREDVFTYLYRKLSGKYCDNPSGQVYEIIENLRKSLYVRYGMPADLEQLLLENNVPNWYVESMKKISYLFPKAHLVQFLFRDICSYVYNIKKID